MNTTASDIWNIQAIDVHAHYGIYGNAKGQAADIQNEWMTCDAAHVAARAREARTQWTIVSPLLAMMPRGQADACVGNEEAARIVPQTPGLLQWVVVDPDNPGTYEQAKEMLQQPHCVGIKIHPEEHLYPIAEQGRPIFEFAEQMNAVVLTHSGDGNSYPADFVPLCNDFPTVRLILAHLGNSAGSVDATLQVRAIQKIRHENVYIDTSSAKSILSNIVEWAVEEVGAERLLYGTDTPLYDAPMQRARIDSAAISDADKRKILRDNAVAILNLPDGKLEPVAG